MRLLHLVVLGTMSAAFASACALAQQGTLPVGTALRIELDTASRVHSNARVSGHLTQSIYLTDHEIIPAGALVGGIIRGTTPGPRKEHIQRLLAADFTPPRIPEVVFQTLSIPAQGSRPATTLNIDAPGRMTTMTVLTLGTHNRKQSLRQRVENVIKQRKQDVEGMIRKPRVVEMVEKWAIGQLPYHPTILWSDTYFNADLRAPLMLGDLPHPTLPVEDLRGRLPEGTLVARLLTPVSSATATHGDSVEAQVAEPMFSPDPSHLLVPEGTHLFGTVVQSRSARSLGRNGSLRFTFNKLDLPTADPESKPLSIHGRLSVAETAPGEHTVLDEEGQTKATDGPGKLAEPAVLAVLAVAATPDDHDHGTADLGSSTVASNGFGLIARVLSLTTRNAGVVQGFAYYALGKSIYYRFLDKGHDTTFDKDTELHVTLSAR